MSASKQVTQTIDNTDAAISLSFWLPAGGAYPADLRVRLSTPIQGTSEFLVVDDLAANVPRTLSGITGTQAANFLKDCRNWLVQLAGYA